MQDLTQYYTAKLPDQASLEALVTGEREGVAYDAKAVLLTESFTPFVLADPPNPADASDVTDWIVTATVDRNTTNDVMTTGQLELDAAIGDQINTLRVYIQFWRQYWDLTDLDPVTGEPDLLLSAPVAIVGFQIPDRKLDDAGSTITVQGYEATWRIRDLFFQNPFTVPAGMLFTDVMAAMARMDGLTPSEGGRQPSGVAAAGGPQSQFPSGPPTYCAVGVPATTVCTQTATDGSLIDPNGLFNYNPDADILVDATSHIPIDPWTCQPMDVVVEYQDTCQASNGLYFHTRTGAFYQLGYPQGFATAPIDPFTMQPLPAGLQYIMPNPAAPASTVGTIPCPLVTWPYDYTGAGPYYSTGGAPQTTSGGGSNTTTGPGPTSLPAGSAATIGSRDGTGTITVVTHGLYTVEPALCSNDPALPGHTWCQPRSGIPFDSDTASVDGYAWPAGDWVVSLTLRGAPLPAGEAAISATLYFRSPDGTQTLLGTCAEGLPEIFGSGASSLALSCSVPVAAINAPPGAVIMAQITLDAITDLSATLGTTVGKSSFAVSDITVSFPQPTVTTTTTTGSTTSGGNHTTQPVSTGTVVPWPDTNDPGICPNGCQTPGPNIPQQRLNITPSPLPVPAPIAWDRQTNMLAAFIALCTAINYNPPWTDERSAVLQFAPKPLFSQAIPEAVWSFTTEANQVIKPPFTQRLADQTGLKNKVIVVSSNNNATPIVAMGTNESLGSIISIPNLGREVMGTPVQDDNIPDQQTAELRVQQELQASASAMEAIQFSGVHIPFLQPFDPISVTVTALDGTPLVDAGPYPYFLTDIQFDLMDITNCTYTAGRAIAV